MASQGRSRTTQLCDRWHEELSLDETEMIRGNIMVGRSTNDLERIASAGGGFRISATRGANDLVRIAAAASSHHARIVIYGTDGMTTDDLVRVGAAGKGVVSFE